MMSVCSRIRARAGSSVCIIGPCPNRGRNPHTSSIMSTTPSSFCCFTFSPGNSGSRYSRISVSNSPSSSSSCSLQIFQRMYFRSRLSKKRGHSQRLVTKSSSSCSSVTQVAQFNCSVGYQNATVGLSLPKVGLVSKLKCTMKPLSWSYSSASVGLIFGLLVCFSSSHYSNAEAPRKKDVKEQIHDKKVVSMSHGKTVYTDYSVIGIPGDGRCLFRSVAHGACLRAGKPAPSEGVQRDLADELRARVADEFIKRREETEWFIEGDFDRYVAQMRRPHVWGGEPELLMLSHVLEMPITVYMRDESSGGLISIAEYGEEYGKDNPIRVLYHGFGHYDALLIPGKNKPTQSRL